MPGVLKTAVGYCGGTTENPSYEQVCSGVTDHAEVVQITFDPSKISYAQLLETFFRSHNPTTLNYQGPDFGSQYRSVIFFHSPEQEKQAKAAIEKESRSGMWNRPIVTQVVAAPPFYPAEDYHQQYLKKRGLGSCHI
jgi:peptide-methionine (S)-S-oxide reductase